MKTLLVIFGITGDLSTRKLLPALDHIVDSSDEGISIVGVSRREVNVAELLNAHPPLIEHTTIHTMDLANREAYDGLRERLEATDADQVLFYLSVPPGAAADIVDFLGEAGMNTPKYKVLFEKPFGFDLVSAQEFIQRTARYFEEDQLFRIDHYMAKEVAAELLRLRRNAANHHHSWGKNSISSVSVVASEAIGIEGRAQFYEQTGALRDFIQGHLMQLLSLVLIDKPGSRPLPLERLEVLKQILPADPSKSVRGQYEGYAEEAQNPGSTVETLVSLQLESTDPTWEGVSLRLVTGKALSEKRSYVQIEYVDGTVDVFEEGSLVSSDPTQRTLDAYERVLLEAIAGNKDIFTTSDEVLRAWEIVAPVQYAWSMDDAPLVKYTPGTVLDASLLKD